ncbi:MULTISPECIES: EF-hand domain-containing protein [Actinokineospora]|uniref:Calcium-binding protein n=1 Tax=Actinokineospora fastidiosa TaxID=1816 RepID=A0A918GTP0_9PSEU|nr:MULTISPECIES: EF-hand domain-containing protein [Actinokineospora]UVS81546.1 EF hand [Actinokineospora sp. UTMC 2448]GGS57300.1 calcium-binding protein [Actinokineospora fastidiosa]
MASLLQRGKVSAVFRAMDADGDGCLTEYDFRSIAQRWGRLGGAAPQDRERVTAIMLSWWATVASGYDADGDDRVTVDEVLAVVDRLPAMLDAVAATASAMFDAVDADHDDLISAAEYRTLIEIWNGRRTDTDSVFDILDGDGDGHLSREEFIELWTQFWAGDDPTAPGNWVFGRFALPA